MDARDKGGHITAQAGGERIDGSAPAHGSNSHQWTSVGGERCVTAVALNVGTGSTAGVSHA